MITNVDLITTVQQQFVNVQRKYPNFELRRDFFGNLSVRGPLRATAIHREVEVEVDGFEVEISLPFDYPSRPPVVRELGSRTAGFHTNPDGTFCLGAPLAVRATFRKDPTLLGFIDNTIVPFLFSFVYWKKFGNLPYGELSHGAKGIVEYYRDLLDIESKQDILPLIRVLADDDYRGHILCPCNSGLKTRYCHGAILLEVSELQNPEYFLRDYCQVALEAYHPKDIFPDAARSKRILKKFPHLASKSFLICCYKELELWAAKVN